MFDKQNFPLPRSLWDLACLLPLLHLHRASFLPKMWEVSSPQIWGRLRWFVPSKAVVGPGGRPSAFQHFPTPVVDSTFSWSLPRDPLICGRVSEPFADSERSSSRKTVVFLSWDKGVSLLPQNFCFFSNRLLCYLRRNTCGFVCLFVFSLTCFCVGDVSVLSLLQMGNRWLTDYIFVQIKKSSFRINYLLTEEKLAFGNIFSGK